MTTSSYLKKIADGAVLAEAEKTSISRSIEVLRNRLAMQFSTEIAAQFVFGSYARDTILPRYMDEMSDVDYMVVFSDGNYRPQTYLDKLNRFVSMRYHSSEVAQSYPTIQLELSHIRFELVPATSSWLFGYQIPQRDGQGQIWMQTDPKDVNASLVQKNADNAFLIKPLVRLVKYWNAQNGYPFESFELEKAIIAHDFRGFLGFGTPSDIKGYFFSFMGGGLPVSWTDTQTRKDRVARAKKIIDETKRYEAAGQWAAAEAEIQKLIPDPAGKKLAAALLRR